MAIFGVMPLPPAAFSPLTTTKSKQSSVFREGSERMTAVRPGSPTTSPKNNSRIMSGVRLIREKHNGKYEIFIFGVFFLFCF